MWSHLKWTTRAANRISGVNLQAFANYFKVWYQNWQTGVLSACFKRLASLLIVTQLVNQVTEVVIPFIVDRFISAPHRTETEDDPEEDKFRNQSVLPKYPVSSGARTVIKKQSEEINSTSVFSIIVKSFFSANIFSSCTLKFYFQSLFLLSLFWCFMTKAYIKTEIKIHSFVTGLVCRIHRAPGAVWVFESFLLRLSSDGSTTAHQ